MGSRSTRSSSRPPSNDWVKRGVLTKVDQSTLRRFQVKIVREELLGKIDDDFQDKPINSYIDNPEKICQLVHKRREAYTPGKIFGKNIKVNQYFPDSLSLPHHNDSRSWKKTREYRTPSGSRDNRRGRSKVRSVQYCSQSWKKTRKSRTSSRSSDGSRDSSTVSSRKYRSRSWKNTRKSRTSSRSSDRGQSLSAVRSRSRSRQRYSRSRSGSRDCPGTDRVNERRSITPLRPGEYRPGHPDFVLRERWVFRCSRSPESYKDKTIPMPMNYGYDKGDPSVMIVPTDAVQILAKMTYRI